MKNIALILLGLVIGLAGGYEISQYRCHTSCTAVAATHTDSLDKAASPNKSKSYTFDASKTLVKLGEDPAKNGADYIVYLLNFSDGATIGSIDSFNLGQGCGITYNKTGTSYTVSLLGNEAGVRTQPVTLLKMHTYTLTTSTITSSFGIVTGTDQSSKSQHFNATDIYSINPGTAGGTVVFGVVNLEDAAK